MGPTAGPSTSFNQFSLASDPGIPSANTPRVDTPMPVLKAGFGNPVNRNMLQNFRVQRGGIPQSLSSANLGSSTFMGG